METRDGPSKSVEPALAEGEGLTRGPLDPRRMRIARCSLLVGINVVDDSKFFEDGNGCWFRSLEVGFGDFRLDRGKLLGST